MKWKDLPYELEEGLEYDPDEDIMTRQSEINQMLLCPGRVGFAEHPKYLAMVSEPLAFGTCVHHLISEDLINEEMQETLLLSMNDWVEVILQEQYEWSLDRVPNPRDFFSEIAAAYGLWRTTVLPKLAGREVLAVEEEKTMLLGEGDQKRIFLKGTADIVLADTLMDWKTSGRAWSQDKADYSVQASLYMPLHKQALGVSLQKFSFWVYNRQGSSWDLLTTKRTIPQIDAALATALMFGRQIEAKAFPCTPSTEAFFKHKRGWYCQPKFCSAWNACDAKALPDGFNIKEKAVRSW
jgi:hypothetical protein